MINSNLNPIFRFNNLFVKNFTPLDFQVRNFTPGFSPNLKSSFQFAGQQGQAGGGGGTRQRRERPSFLPEGFNPALFGCLRCGERTDPPHEARNCSLEKKDLECTFCGIKGSHVEAVCFKKLEAEGKLVSKQPPETRSQSPAGGRSQTPGPGVKLNKIVEVGKGASGVRRCGPS